MISRTSQFVALLAVIGASIVFGMVVGGRLNAPQVVLAAPAMPANLPSANPTPDVFTDFSDVVEQAMPAVVSVTSSSIDDEEEGGESEGRVDPFRWFFGRPDDDRNNMRRQPSIGEGSGFIVSEDGYILTNNHVVDGAQRVTVGLSSGKTFEAEVVGTDPSIDLALLKVDSDDRLPTLPLGDSESLRVGQWVIAIGNPLDYEHTVTVGVVSAKKRRVPLRGTDLGVANFIQTDAAINLGNSGGPLIDAGGNVIGINTAITRANFAEGIGFALPVSQARRAMEQLRATGEVRRGFIGITMNQGPIDEETAEYYKLPDTNGVLISRVEPDGPADEAGVREGDIVRRVDGEIVRDNADLIGKISAHMPGDRVDLEVFRDGRTLDLTARLGDREEGLRAQQGNRRDPRQPDAEDEASESEGLGMRVEDLGDYRERLELDDDIGGVIVTDVDLDSQAMDKGIQPFMIVTSINDQPVRGIGDWDTIVGNLRPGSTAKLEVLAGNQGRLVFLRVPRGE